MKVSIKKYDCSEDQVDRLAKILYDVFYSHGIRPDETVTGIFTKPYFDESINQTPEFLEAQGQFYFDNIEVYDKVGQAPVMYHWRKWGFKAQEIIAGIKKACLEIDIKGEEDVRSES